MAILFLIGRIILGIYWLQVAYSHLFKSSHLVGYTKSKGIKAPKLAVIGSGILALVGGLSILLGIYPAWGVAALVIFLLGVSFGIHNYWKIEDPMARMGDQIHFKKNIAFIGATLMFLAIATPWVYSFGW